MLLPTTAMRGLAVVKVPPSLFERPAIVEAGLRRIGPLGRHSVKTSPKRESSRASLRLDGRGDMQ